MVNIELWETRKKQLGWTFDELSQKSGIPKRTILGVFRKEVLTPRIDTVEAIERALGLSEWSAEEKALGVGNHAVELSADEWEWLELRSEILEKGGQNMLTTITELLKTMLKNQKK